jgi:hypothetical protein
MPARIAYPGEQPGKASVTAINRNHVVVENNVIRMLITFNGKRVHINEFEDKVSHDIFKTGSMPLFEIILQDGKVISSNDFILIKQPTINDIPGDDNSSSVAGRFPGKKYVAEFRNRETSLIVHWEADLRDGSNYIRNIFSFSGDYPVNTAKITMLKFPVISGARRIGSVDGSPVIKGNMFFALEHPLGKTEQNEKFLISFLPRLISDISTVWGVTPENQLRRGFLYYVERERLHPYHQVLHYNSWYDISWHDRKFDERLSSDRIRTFGDSLVGKRGVKMKGFLFDDGWDDNRTLWKFHSGFPEGFSNLKKEAEKYNTEIGIWLSPFGGYGPDKLARIDYGNKQIPPFETNEQGFSLSGPVYYKRFLDVTSDFIKNYDIAMFKFDGVGRGSGAETIYQKDVEAFLTLLKDLHILKPDLYLSLTTGTWPSVYWLKYGDNIWRGGDDTNMTGEGSKRQKWITYRDAQTFKNIVRGGPLYPLNSLMLCGICIADLGMPRQFEIDDKDISDEIWSFFGTGTNLQELYINPHDLNTATWDCLAGSAKWALDNEPVMVDVHWTGGDPAKGEVYGFAAWSPAKAALTLRNPSSVEKIFEINTTDVFELPKNAGDEFYFYDVIKAVTNKNKEVFARGRVFTIKLKPFEVAVFDALPVRPGAE